jgi:hypothetical protein
MSHKDDDFRFERTLFWGSLIVGIALAVSGCFIYQGYRTTSGHHENVSIQGEWVPARSDINESYFSCPGSGELVGNVWQQSAGVWKSRTNYSPDHDWNRLEADFKDEDHAKSAAEAFIQKHSICDTR